MDTEGFDGPVTITDAGERQPEATTLARGTTVARYIVADLVGRGGMGVVYKAFDPELNRPVALKLLSIARGDDQSSQGFAVHKARLLREAQALAQLSHPNVVTVYDVGTHGDAVFMAMEYVEGKDLKAVLGEPGHSPEELLEILKAAGRGLAAAHKVGIVHRDFKPGNILIGNDGRVRVIDFGLARGATEAGSAAPGAPQGAPERPQQELEKWYDSSGNLLSSTLTQAGAIVGTPHYMAPEQHLAQTADDKSDQFSFCVVLFEALYGVQPFGGRSLKEMVQKITQGQIERPEAHDVPSWLDRIAARGLSVDPAGRYASIEALLADLENDPAIARARKLARALRWTAAVGFVLLGAATAYGFWYGTTRGARQCGGSEQNLAGIWDEGARARVEAAFLATSRAHARDTFERTRALLDRYAQTWVERTRAACEASYVHGSQSEKILHLRTGCLEQRLAELKALAEVFTTRVDDQVVDKAVQAASELTGLALCDDTRTLLARVPPPTSPATQRSVKAVREKLAAAEALERAGKYREGLELVEKLQAATRETSYLPALAEGQVLLGKLTERVARFEEARNTLLEASRTADRAGDDDSRLRALNLLVWTTGYRMGHYGEAEAFSLSASAVADRIEERGEQAARWQVNQAILFWKRDLYDQALEHFTRAHALFTRSLGARHPEVARVLGNIGVVYMEKKEYRRALNYYEQALAMFNQMVGPEHPLVASMLLNVGALLYVMGDYERARTTDLQALHLLEQTVGPNHPDVAKTLTNLGLVSFYQGRPDEAQGYYERSIALWTAELGPASTKVAGVLGKLGKVYQSRGEDKRALEAYRQAQKILEKSLGPADPELCETLGDLGVLELARGDLAAAEALFSRALAIRERTVGATNPVIAWPICGLGWVLLKRQQPRAAIARFERVLAICAKDRCQGDEREPFALAVAGLAIALADSAADGPRAEALSEEALRLLAEQRAVLARALVTQATDRLTRLRSRRR